MPAAFSIRRRSEHPVVRDSLQWSVLIRDFRRTDFDRLWRIDQECFEPGISYTKVELAHYIALRGSFTLVAEEEPGNERARPERAEGRPRLSTILGFVVAQRDRRGRGHIVTIDVLGSARRSGVGTELMAAAERRLREQGCDLVYLEAAVNNEPALRFYARHGYSVIQTIPRYYQGELDAFMLAKKLSPLAP